MNPLYAARLLVMALLLAACQDSPEPVTRWVENPASSLPEHLSETGLFADIATHQVATDMIPYDLRYPLYSDGNAKQRFLYLPPEARIDNRDEREWIFPRGATLFKTFRLTAGGEPSARPMETRVLHKSEQRWITGTYRWNAAGTEAVLTEGAGVSIATVLPDGPYTYRIPGRFDCVACHHSTADYVTGFEQMNLNLPEAKGNQIDRLNTLGVFQNPLTPVTVSSNPLEADVLGYLHANCSNCHNPRSQTFFTTELDLRYWNSRQGLVDVAPRKFLSGDPDIRLIRSGDTDASLVYLMMSRALSDSTLTMPPIGTSRADEDGLATLARWIESLNP